MQVWGAMMRHYRERAGLSCDQLAGIVYLSAPMLHKVEAGARAPSRDLVRRCEQSERLSPGGVLGKLYDEMRPFLKFGVHPAWLLEWADKEKAARLLLSVSLLVLDGLLQTEGYARAILATRDGITPEEVDEQVTALLARQEVLTRAKPVRLRAIVDEGVLRRQAGSRQVMREACEHLAEMAARPNITLQVIPLAAGAHEGLRGSSFILAELDGAPAQACQDTAAGGQVIEEPEQVAGLRQLWDTLQAVTLPAEDSLRMIEKIGQEWQ
jgi:transcriptional regulator with XRE-family HTH domain